MDEKIGKELKDWAEALCTYIPYFESIEGMEGCGWFLGKQSLDRTIRVFYCSEHYKLRDFFDSFYFGLFMGIGLEPENFLSDSVGPDIRKESIRQADAATVLETLYFYYLERFSDYFSSKGTKDGIILMALYRLKEILENGEMSLSGRYLQNIHPEEHYSVYRYKYRVMEDRSSYNYYRTCTEKLCFFIPFFENIRGKLPVDWYPEERPRKACRKTSHLTYDETLSEFFKLICDTGFRDFDYSVILEYKGTTEDLLELISVSDAEISRAMLTFYCQWERFDAGLWNVGAYNGTILTALYRLRELFLNG